MAVNLIYKVKIDTKDAIGNIKQIDTAYVETFEKGTGSFKAEGTEKAKNSFIVINSRSSSMFPNLLTIDHYAKVLTEGSPLSIYSDNNATGGDGTLNFIIMYNEIIFESGR